MEARGRAVPSRAEVAAALALPSLRPGQYEAIVAALNGRDSLVLLPTGAGKSACFQALPRVAGRRGVVVVVSPLLSLHQDQVSALVARGYRARSLSSARPAAENKETLRLLREMAEERAGDSAGDGSEGRAAAGPRGLAPIELLYCSPEALVHGKLLGALGALARRRRLLLVAVDEAHCISSWGHDFRHSYLRLGGALREALPDGSTPLMALTATATPQVTALP
jgi:ATP-dependent DNA helicase RecQ